MDKHLASTLGFCADPFQSAANLLFYWWFSGEGGRKARLCHGLLPAKEAGPGGGVRRPHAWLETTDEEGAIWCHDVSNDRVSSIPQFIFYAARGVRERQVIRYTTRQARANLVETSSHGPWQSPEERVPCSKAVAGG